MDRHPNRNAAKVQSEGREMPRIVELADQLEKDIVAKGLQAGDPYLTSEEAAGMLKAGISVRGVE